MTVAADVHKEVHHCLVKLDAGHCGEEVLLLVGTQIRLAEELTGYLCEEDNWWVKEALVHASKVDTVYQTKLSLSDTFGLKDVSYKLQAIGLRELL